MTSLCLCSLGQIDFSSRRKYNTGSMSIYHLTMPSSMGNFFAIDIALKFKEEIYNSSKIEVLDPFHK